jgi:hypothetical protein
VDPALMHDVTQDTTIARATVPARAVVCAAGVDTEYLRAGRGIPLILVVPDVDADEVRTMIEWLSARFLVLAAAPTVSGADALGSWLREFMEGLGLADDAHVMLHASVSPRLLTGE